MPAQPGCRAEVNRVSRLVQRHPLEHLRGRSGELTGGALDVGPDEDQPRGAFGAAHRELVLAEDPLGGKREQPADLQRDDPAGDGPERAAAPGH